MKVVAETIAALGHPLLLRTIGSDAGPQALIGRWQHGDARVETEALGALRVVLVLGGGQTVRHGRGHQAARAVVAGSVGVFAADTYSNVQIEGYADVVQIFIDPACLNEAAGSRFVCAPSFDLHDAQLQAAALRVFVGAREEGPDGELLMETGLWQIVEYLIERQTPDRLKRPMGGMSHGAMRRVEALIADRLNAADTRAPSIGDFAGAARMSASHFIRAFKQSTGATPHQHVMARRIERAMDLLARPTSSIAEVADSTGYASPSHFVASFRHRLGMTPGTYRRAVLD